MQGKNYVYANGGFVPPDQACVSIFDSGFLFGDGVFETMRVYGGKIFRFDQHMWRLFDGLHHLRIEPNVSAEKIGEIFRALCEKEVVHGVARIYVTRGLPDLAGPVDGVDEPTVVAWAWPQPLDPTPAPLRVMTSTVRVDSQSLLTRIKSANRLPFILAHQEAKLAGVDDALLLNEHGRVTELTAYNIFAVVGGRVFTPPASDGALPGITRAVVLELSQQLGIPAEEMELKPSMLAEAQEIFATNSVREIVPVTEMYGRELWCHSIAEKLTKAFRHLVYDELAL